MHKARSTAAWGSRRGIGIMGRCVDNVKIGPLRTRPRPLFPNYPRNMAGGASVSEDSEFRPPVSGPAVLVGIVCSGPGFPVSLGFQSIPVHSGGDKVV